MNKELSLCFNCLVEIKLPYHYAYFSHFGKVKKRPVCQDCSLKLKDTIERCHYCYPYRERIHNQWVQENKPRKNEKKEAKMPSLTLIFNQNKKAQAFSNKLIKDLKQQTKFKKITRRPLSDDYLCIVVDNNFGKQWERKGDQHE